MAVKVLAEILNEEVEFESTDRNMRNEISDFQFIAYGLSLCSVSWPFNTTQCHAVMHRWQVNYSFAIARWRHSPATKHWLLTTNYRPTEWLQRLLLFIVSIWRDRTTATIVIMITVNYLLSKSNSILSQLRGLRTPSRKQFLDILYAILRVYQRWQKKYRLIGLRSHVACPDF